jgi:hypothetical protein
MRIEQVPNKMAVTVEVLMRSKRRGCLEDVEASLEQEQSVWSGATSEERVGCIANIPCCYSPQYLSDSKRHHR